MNNKRKVKKITVGILVGIGLSVLTIFTALMVLMTLFLFGPSAKTSKNIADYQEIFNEKGLQSGLIVFPDQIPESACEVEFYHYYRDTAFEPKVETFLQCSYSEKDFAEEVGRLEKTHKAYSDRTVYLMKDVGIKYPYTAFVAIDYAPVSYEYALITGENQITYVFVMNKDRLYTDDKYLPKDFMVDKTLESAYDCYFNIYIINESGNARNMDYSRDEYVTVYNCHYKDFGEKGSVCVRTEYDTNHTEKITEYEYQYPQAVYYNKPEKSVYHDLDGYEYLYFDINYDLNEAIIGYRDNGEEKELVYKLP